MGAKYRAVIIGCGQIARSHATGYKGIEETDLVAVADPNERVRGEFQGQFEVPRGYADFRKMLEKERPKNGRRARLPAVSRVQIAITHRGWRRARRKRAS